MPIFEYRCGRCGRVFETLVHGPGRETAPVCPGCGKAEAERLLSPIARPAAGAGGCSPKSSRSR